MARSTTDENDNGAQGAVVVFKIGRGGEIRTRDHYTPSVVRYQAALRPDERRDSSSFTGRAGSGKTSTAQQGQYFFQFHPHLTHDLVGNTRLHPRLRAFQPRARAGDGKALVV